MAVKTVNYNQQDCYKAMATGDIYSLGMVMLECFTFEMSTRYYSSKILDVKQEKLTARLVKTKECYELLDFIRRCL
jgi:hypothetical protein